MPREKHAFFVFVPFQTPFFILLFVLLKAFAYFCIA